MAILIVKPSIKLEYIIRLSQKVDKMIIVLFINFILFSCNYQKDIMNSINVHEWNEKTINLLNNKCNISKFDYNKMINAPAPYIVVYDKKFYTIKDEIEFWLNRRAKMIDELKMQFHVNSEFLEIIEMHYSERVTFIVRDDSNRYYHIEISGIENFITKSELLKENNEYFESFKWEFDNTKVEYLNSIESHLRGLRIISSIKVKDNKTEYLIKYVYLY